MILPEEFFSITFLPPEKYYPRGFGGSSYRIIGEDDVGNYIGEAANGAIYLLDTAAEPDQELIYMAKSITTLDQAIRTCLRHQEDDPLPDDSPEEAFEENARQLAEKLTALDPAMLRDESTFWSPLIEEMAQGMI